MLPQNAKTVAFRNQLRQSLESSDWRSQEWSSNVLAAECLQGWAGRKDPEGPTMLHLYCLRAFNKSVSIKALAKYLRQQGVPPFNLVPIHLYTKEINANRLPRKDTQDRFWLMGSYNAIDVTHWDHWSRTKRYWGNAFSPSENEALRILNDPQLFEAMIESDWDLVHHTVDGKSHWNEIVQRYHAQWPQYSMAMQLLNPQCAATKEDFLQGHRDLRAQFFAPIVSETYALP